jgi:hypothetical protein
MPAWAAIGSSAPAVALLKSGITLAAGLALHRLLRPPQKAPGPDAIPVAWRGLEGLDDLLGAIVLLGASLIGLLRTPP